MTNQIGLGKIWLKSDENRMAATTIRTDMKATFGHAKEKDSTVNHMKLYALRANKIAFSKTFVFRELTADKPVVHKPHDNKCIFVRKKNALCFNEYKC